MAALVSLISAHGVVIERRVAVAAIGAVIVVITALRDKEILDLKKRGIVTASDATADADEEDFFA